MKLLLLLGIPVPVVFAVEEDSSTSCTDMVVDGMITVGLLLVTALEHDGVCWSSNNASHRKPEHLDHPALILMRCTSVKLFR
jgi:hypothetical protein